MLLALLCLLAIAATIAWQRHRWHAQCRAAAAKIHGELAALYGGEQRLRVASEADFPGFDLTAHRQMREALGPLGFRHLGCLENVTVGEVYPQNRSPMDVYADETGSIAACFYRIPQAAVLDLGTTFVDGRQLLTNTAESDKLTPPPTTARESLPGDSKPEAVLARHRQRLEERLRAEPTLATVPARSLEDVLEHCRRYAHDAGEHRRSLGLITEAELLRLTAPGQEPTTRLVFKYFRERMSAGTGA